ncbi:hypothetical protein Hypma_015918 [Hypsizygus marmoreus]|uniref:Copper transporter n=1 Tax=Hypsizygus marmoreus TaxID=39966 RepID=A0A369K4I7_HYPMA|nr:hypothetical protein Hypma_015918 [Hypsizygus marmoreus]
MHQWESHLHWSFLEQHVLMPSITLDSFSGFLAASLLTMCICVAERCLTRLLEKQWQPPFVRYSRWQKCVSRGVLYWLATFARLSYMLIAMTFHLGLILVITTTLTITQSVIELLNPPNSQKSGHGRSATDSDEPLLHERSYDRGSVITRPRSKSKPDHIFIHPNHSNIARADAAALELGISGNTDRVHGNRYEREETAWRAGEGKEAARALLGSTRKAAEDQFHISNDSDSD